MTLFVGIHTVQVVVTDTSAAHQIDTGAVQQALIRELNARSNHTHFRAMTEGDADCKLSLDIVDEEGHETRAYPGVDGADWQFHAVTSVRLTGRDGHLIWANPTLPMWDRYFFRKIKQRKITPGWSDPTFREEFAKALASQLVYQVLSK